ncbi:hypothetical protein D9Q98_005114 [Chlorella vulgaris]|uniref:Uncharacterized protein n=1 Tax=Chlorella vulgaris TaxID=3077 RepID=A0A9D4TNU6_CHLVU|nr:hypothetical protein D9Q98_005114 [Chlorella vulgaris]
MADEGRPNPITKAAEASTLPRQARARIGQTTDPMPEGKVLDAAPELHFPLEPADHDSERSKPQPFGDLSLVERTAHMKELNQKHGGGDALYNRKDKGEFNRPIMQGTSTAANKLMDSRRRGNDFPGCSSKHLDTVTRSK